MEVDDNCELFFNHSIHHLQNLQDRKLRIITGSILIDRKRLYFLAWLETLENENVTEIISFRDTTVVYTIIILYV